MNVSDVIFFPLETKKLKNNNNNAWSQVIIDHNMHTYYQVKHRLQASIFDISHWLPCGADGHVITKISRMDRLPNFLRYGVPLLQSYSAVHTI